MKNQKHLVSVTKQDIKLGVPKKSTKCPIAIALNRKFPGVNEYSCYWYFFHGHAEGKHLIACSKKAERFVDAFDDGKKVNPFKFYVKEV